MDGPEMSLVSRVAPTLLGGLCNTFLFGILIVQLYIYYLSFPTDPISFKLLVYTVVALDTAATIMNISDMYRWFAEGFGDFSLLNDILLSPIYIGTLGAVIAGIVQLFYAYRIYKIESKVWIISVFVFILVLAQVAAGIWSAISAMHAKTHEEAGAGTLIAPWILFVGPAFADTIIALTIIVLLGRKQLKSQGRINSSVGKIIQLTAETNMLSTTLAIITMVLYAVEPETHYFLMTSTLLGKIYSNSLLLILNNRHYLAADAQKGTRGNGANNSESSNQRSRTNTFGMKAMPSYSKSMEQSSGGRFDVNLSVDKSTKSKASAWV